ncbi:MAG: carboxymuconolactone decarboxylase family protein, partial [Rhizomicrobium sp.]
MNLALVTPEAMVPIKALYAASQKNLSPATHALVHLRVSQINGCSSCVDGGNRQARAAGEKEERLATVVAWRDAPYFNAAERAALALAEGVTRM